MTDNFIESITLAIRSVVGSGFKALHEPEFNGNELEYVKDCIDSTFVSSIGKYVDRFESELASFMGVKHAIAVVNGTAALHVALRLAGVRSGDEVLMPALTFVATANAVSYCNGVPHFVGSEAATFGIDAALLREYLNKISEQRNGLCVNLQTGRVIRALIPMHTFGHPSDIDGLLGVSRDFNIIMVEDAAESLGSKYKGRHTGSFGRLGTLSFNGNKILTTGGGGAIITNDAVMARYAKHLTTTAKLPHPWEYRHDEIGYNYRLPNLNAALGCAQLEKLPSMISAKRELFKRYQKSFSNIDGVQIYQEPLDSQSNYWLQTLIIKDEKLDQRDAILQTLNDSGLMARPAWTLLNELAPYRDCPSMELQATKILSRRIINIPSSSKLL